MSSNSGCCSESCRENPYSRVDGRARRVLHERENWRWDGVLALELNTVLAKGNRCSLTPQRRGATVLGQFEPKVSDKEPVSHWWQMKESSRHSSEVLTHKLEFLFAQTGRTEQRCSRGQPKRSRVHETGVLREVRWAHRHEKPLGT